MAETQNNKDSGKKKVDSKTVGQQKKRRRQWVTFVRMCRYGINNFTRNAWLTIAATAVMTITLLIIFVTAVAHNVLTDTVDSLRDKVDMSIYVKTDTSDDAIGQIRTDLQNLPSVTDVRYITPAEAREEFVRANANDADMIDAVKEAVNSFPGTFRVKVLDINDTTELASFVNDNQTLQENIDPNRSPSFAGERRSSIQAIGRTASFAQRAGIGASAVFVVISMLIIFNTIRMAIFNRREEIHMMKLIGAEKSFIRGPFLVEAMVYGFIAALIASGVGYAALVVSAPSLKDYQINIQPTLDMLTLYAGFALLAMIVIGAIIGIISSLLATRRYLKI